LILLLGGAVMIGWNKYTILKKYNESIHFDLSHVNVDQSINQIVYLLCTER